MSRTIYRRWPQVKHDGKHIIIDAEGFTLKPEDHDWIHSQGGYAKDTDEGIVLTYPTLGHAAVAFSDMIHAGRCGLKKIRNMVFINAEAAALAKRLQGWGD